MKAYFLGVLIIIAFLIFVYSCNSKSYEIVEEIDSSDIAAKNEIKQEISEPKIEIKQETKLVPKNTFISYTIQLGAFEKESNAGTFLEGAKKVLTGDIYSKLVNGLFKVRIGNYTTKEDAYSMLDHVRDSGYDDAFIIEIKK